MSSIYLVEFKIIENRKNLFLFNPVKKKKCNNNDLGATPSNRITISFSKRNESDAILMINLLSRKIYFK